MREFVRLHRGALLATGGLGRSFEEEDRLRRQRDEIWAFAQQQHDVFAEFLQRTRPS